MRAAARACFEAGVAAADPAGAARRALARNPGFLGDPSRLSLFAIGKAARPMMRAALDAAPGARAMLITNYENAGPVAGCDGFAAGHPEPDSAGARAAGEVVRRLAALGAEERAVLLLSGGGSALAPAPLDGLPLADKIAVNALLLRSGAPIDEINAVRKRLSRLKGGGFARLAAPASVGALILSDVPGDDLAVVASGPTVANPDPPERAEAVLRARGVWDAAPETVRAALSRPAETTAAPEAENILVGGNALSVAAMVDAAPAGWEAQRHPGWLDGDVSEAAARIAGDIRDALSRGRRAALFYGGETTVVVRGGGKGGRNQELALRVAMLLESDPPPGVWAMLSGGTDGRDGPTDAAGGIVDPGSLARMRAAGVDPAAALADNDAYAALAASGDLLHTGATGTNVADLQAVFATPAAG